MRKIFAFLMITADGYHATSEGDLFWHNVDDEFHEFALAQLDAADTLLFGRATYQGMAEFWSSPVALEEDPAMTERMNRYRKVVVSSTLAATEWTPSTLIRDDVISQLTSLKEESGKDIALLGSSTLAAGLLTAGLIDELRLMVNPVVLGSGQQVLAGAELKSLQLLRTRQFASGNVLLTYRPRPKPGDHHPR
ncbi:MAG TPA: dihydrofolate reductase family protein [Streptosporangiaceae bacterium]|nr:dihydrofolate reductase family protein [Streptosporangiaceae bacterium]